ncbi:hypothetical protein [uncultured Nostoc sp.]|uniref:hypothetical protein n=1 Tax=uncultured Nostoc sp. TaxID=340711 RepID=UPI002613516A|nr:hypothetical protein [uncultured Nostoc sp.]
MIAGKLEITIKINELLQPKTVENAWQQFDLNCDGHITTITVKPKIYKRLTNVTSNYPQWLTAIAGKLGQSTKLGFVLELPKMQVFFSQAQGRKALCLRCCFLKKRLPNQGKLEQTLINIEESNTNVAQSGYIRKDHKLGKIKLIERRYGGEDTTVREFNAQSATKE